MKYRKIIAAAMCALAVTMVAGCGGGSGSPAAPKGLTKDDIQGVYKEGDRTYVYQWHGEYQDDQNKENAGEYNLYLSTPKMSQRKDGKPVYGKQTIWVNEKGEVFIPSVAGGARTVYGHIKDNKMTIDSDQDLLHKGTYTKTNDPMPTDQDLKRSNYSKD